MIVTKLTSYEVEDLLKENKVSEKKRIKIMELIKEHYILIVYDTKITICMLDGKPEETTVALRNRYGRNKDKYNFARAVSICMGRLLKKHKKNEMSNM